MNFLTEEHHRLQTKLKELDYQEQTRKSLIRLCVYRLIALKNGLSETPAAELANANALTEKVHDYERRVSVLKQQLSTKEKVHEALVDELKSTIADLNRQLEQSSQNFVLPKAQKKNSFLSPPSSAKHRKSMPHFTDHSFFSPGDNKSVFSKLVFSPVLSRPSLAGTKAPPLGSKAKSLKESLATQAKEDNTKADKSQLEPAATIPNSLNSPSANTSAAEKQPAPDNDEIEANLTTVNHSTSVDDDDSFRSASADLLSRPIAIPRKSKKSKVRLVSSEATRLPLSHHKKGLLVEDEEMNSLDFYNDENFAEDNHSSPIRPAKRPREESDEPEETPRKKHVFKI